VDGKLGQGSDDGAEDTEGDVALSVAKVHAVRRADNPTTARVRKGF